MTECLNRVAECMWSSMGGCADGVCAAKVRDDKARARGDLPYKIDEEALAKSWKAPLQGIIDQKNREIQEALTKGIPVTIWMGGRKLYTYHPDGTMEDHQWEAGTRV